MGPERRGGRAHPALPRPGRAGRRLPHLVAPDGLRPPLAGRYRVDVVTASTSSSAGSASPSPPEEWRRCCYDSRGGTRANLMRLFDTHAHLHFPELLADLDAVLDRARAAGVAAMVTVGTDRETNPAAVALAERLPGRLRVGRHPSPRRRGGHRCRLRRDGGARPRLAQGRGARRDGARLLPQPVPARRSGVRISPPAPTGPARRQARGPARAGRARGGARHPRRGARARRRRRDALLLGRRRRGPALSRPRPRSSRSRAP